MELSLKIENFKLNYSTHPEVPQYGSNVFLLGQNTVYLKSGVPPESETSAYLIPPPPPVPHLAPFGGSGYLFFTGTLSPLPGDRAAANYVSSLAPLLLPPLLPGFAHAQ